MTLWNEIYPSSDAIDEVLNQCAEQEDQGGSRWSSMTYEQGVRAGIEWLLGISEDNPLEE